MAKRWATVVVAHGLGLLFLLVALRLEKARDLPPGPDGVAEWILFFLPDLALVVLFAAFGWLLGAGRRRRALVVGVHMVLAAVTVTAHTFLLQTGFRPRLDLVLYAANHGGMLGGLLASGMDSGFWVRVGFAAAGVGLAMWLSTREATWEARRSYAAWGLLAAPLFLGLAHRGLPARLANLAGSDVGVLAASALPRRAAAAPSRFMVEPEDFYRRPSLAGSEVPRRPNIVLFLMESTGVGVVAPYVDDARTPAFARLAASGALVETAYTTVTHTSKALVGLLCGMYPRSEMRTVESLEGNLPLTCLPRLLGDLGYRTVFLQSALGRFENRPGLVANMGFQEGAYRETLEREGFERLGYLGLDDAAMLEPALGWIARVGAQPYFLTLLTSAPHHPYQPPGASQAAVNAEPRRHYLATLVEQDRLLARLVEGLDALGSLDDTVIVVVGDHGESFGSHGRLQHDAVPYEEVVRVPWLFHGPGPWEAGSRVGGLRHQVDLLPTILGLLGAEWEGVLPGTDLFASPGHDSVISACWFRETCLAFRSGDRKAVYHYGLHPTEVYDLATDPGERRDLAPTLPAETLREIEDRARAFHLSTEGFWSGHPIREGAERWWADDGVAATAGAQGRAGG